MLELVTLAEGGSGDGSWSQAELDLNKAHCLYSIGLVTLTSL